MLSEHDLHKVNKLLTHQPDYSLRRFDDPELKRLEQNVSRAEQKLFEARAALQQAARKKLAEHKKTGRC
ncbi:hypothetical protein [Corynebacterium ulceribovis]|uniref:hypothetical protein n=1 Tax=Corynebacterium ulceribovis TaxID=487732 RepID=UPI00036711E6|nr:hypothetical protein [Corynebacterium ulceribovis]